MIIDTHNRKMAGLLEASEDTALFTSDAEYIGHLELFYDTDDGDVWTVYQYGENRWTVYRAESIIKICDLYRPHKPQELADLIDKRLAEIDAQIDYLNSAWRKEVYYA